MAGARSAARPAASQGSQAASKTRRVFFSIEFVNGIRRAILFTLALLYFVSLGYDPVKVTAVMAISRVLLSIFEFPTGAFADYYSRKKSVILSFAIMGLAFAGFFFFKGFWQLSLCYILSDIGWTFQSGISMAWAIDALKLGGKKIGITRLLSRFFFFERVGAVLGGVIGYLILGFEFRYVWLFVAVINILMMAFLIRHMDESNFIPPASLQEQEGEKKSSKKQNGKRWSGMKSLRHLIWNTFRQAKDALVFLFHKRNRQLQGLAFGIITASLVIDSFSILNPLMLFQVLHLGTATISAITGGISVILMAAALLASYAAAHIGFRESMTGMFLAMAAAIVIFAFSHSVVISLVTLTIVAISDYSGGIISLALQQHNIPSRSRATLGSAMNALWSLTNALSAGLVSLGLLFFGLVATTALTSVFALASALIYFLTLKD